MIAEKHRILICPSDSSNRINDSAPWPITSSVGIKDSDAIKNGRLGSAVAIIGWVDETTSADTIVVVGSISLPLAFEEEGKGQRETEGIGIEVITNRYKYILRSISHLAEKYQCGYSSDAGRCGDCCNCITYHSLKVLGIVDNAISDTQRQRKEDSSRNNKRGRYQIILYNQTEAQEWHLQNFDPPKQLEVEPQRQKRLYPDGTWQRNALRMGEALGVFKKVISTMKNMQHCQTKERVEGGNMITTPVSQGRTYHIDDVCDVCNSRVEPSLELNQLDDGTYFDLVLCQSLLVQHLKSGRQSPKMNRAHTTVPIFAVLHHLLQTKGKSICVNSQLIALILDSILGLIIGYILLSYSHSIAQYIIHLWDNFHNRHWDEWLRWLESFPAGFKLNVALTQQMGKEVRLALEYRKQIASIIFRDSGLDTATTNTYPIISGYLGLSSTIFGSRFFFAFAFDMTRIALLHIYFLSYLFASFQRLELSTLTSLWLLFRGKKRNVLRQRSDHLKYDHMQLLLGMILFTICLFMFTTILVYHFFFATIDFMVQICVSGFCWCGYMIVEGVERCDTILVEKRIRQNKSWMGSDVKFLPAELPDMSYLNYFLGDVSNVLRGDTDIPILHQPEPGNEMDIQQRTKKSLPCISVISEKKSTMKVVFPSKSSSSIIVTTMCSFLISKLSRIIIFVQRLLFGTSCPVASAFVEICQKTK